MMEPLAASNQPLSLSNTGYDRWSNEREDLLNRAAENSNLAYQASKTTVIPEEEPQTDDEELTRLASNFRDLASPSNYARHANAGIQDGNLPKAYYWHHRTAKRHDQYSQDEKLDSYERQKHSNATVLHKRAINNLEEAMSPNEHIQVAKEYKCHAKDYAKVARLIEEDARRPNPWPHGFTVGRITRCKDSKFARNEVKRLTALAEGQEAQARFKSSESVEE